MDQSYQRRLQNELHRVFSLPPNDLGNKWLTAIYKYITHPLKKMPFVYIIPLSIVASFMMYVIFGQLVVKLVSILQYGF